MGETYTSQEREQEAGMEWAFTAPPFGNGRGSNTLKISSQPLSKEKGGRVNRQAFTAPPFAEKGVQQQPQNTLEAPVSLPEG